MKNSVSIKKAGISQWLFLGLLIVQILSCSKDESKPEPGSPAIEFKAETGEYKVKTGHEVTLEAEVSEAINPVYSWKLDGKIISTGLTCVFNGSRTGEYFVTFRVDAENGSAEKQIKVSVLTKLPPEIAMATTIIAYAGQDTRITAHALYAENARYVWRLNGNVAGSDSTYIFNQSAMGTHQLTLKVFNDDGEDLKVFALTVLPVPVPELFFDDGRFRLKSDQTIRRLSVPLGRSLVLAPVISNIPSSAIFEWTVDGVVQSSVSEYLSFTPRQKGTYLITVTAKGTSPLATAKVNVECVAPEGTYFRTAAAGSKAIATTAFEFIPAPGQFTNFQEGSTAEQARVSIQNALNTGGTGYIASLGAYGGYFITGFDHSVSNVEGKADLSISGNAFSTWAEPGIVWVMQDENGNGLPDDTWYELKGSESGKPATKQRYAITYYRPSADGADVLWTDNLGRSGSVDYNAYHTQRSYFPMFIKESSYTLSGTCLASTMVIGSLETSAGYPWGYVDDLGDGSKPNFWIEDAIKADGTPANLKYIDFVKVHTGMTGKGASLGEISTEAGAPFDLNLK